MHGAIFNIKKTLTVSAARILLIVVSAAVILVACNDPAPVAEKWPPAPRPTPTYLVTPPRSALPCWTGWRNNRWSSERGSTLVAPGVDTIGSGLRLRHDPTWDTSRSL